MQESRKSLMVSGLIMVTFIATTCLSYSDTIYLKNGRTFEGVVKEDERGYWVDGVLFNKNEVNKTDKSSEKKINQPDVQVVEKIELTDKDAVINTAFKEFTDSLQHPRSPNRYSEITEDYQNAIVKMGSSNVNMMPVLLELVKKWHIYIGYIYGHYRRGYVLLIIKFKENIDVNEVGKAFAERFAKKSEIEGKIIVESPIFPYASCWHFDQGVVRSSE